MNVPLPIEIQSARFRHERSRKVVLLASFLAVLLLCAAFWRLAWGEMEISISDVFRLLFGDAGGNSDTPEHLAIIVRSVRLPRLIAAMAAGASLAVSGVVLQGVLRNPLAEPYTLGIASGAAFGGAFVFSMNVFAVVPAAFAGALTALGMVCLLAKYAGGGRVHIVLAGIIVSAFLSAGVTFLKAVADERLSAIVMWLMGGFSGAAPAAANAVLLSALIVFMVSWIFGRRLDALSLGEDAGNMLGVNERQLRIILLCATSLASAASVSFFGIIGFVGLVVPHLLRMLIGPLHRPLLFCSFLAGAFLTAVADGIAQRCHELPVGVITALLGVPFFCWIMVRRKMMSQ